MSQTFLTGSSSETMRSDSTVGRGPSIAVVIPCHNEAVAIAKVVADFRAGLPDAAIYVYDNNSTDGTIEEARRAGAVVRTETQQGKGHVVRRMFADVEADIYIMVDGDDTYDSTAAPEMVRMLLDQQLDMVVAVRVTDEAAAYRTGHRVGNAMLTAFVRRFFGRRVSDVMTGLRVFSRRYVKSFPMLRAVGFNVDPAFSIHALELRMPIAEIRTPYRARPEGSVSKLRTYTDGWRVLLEIFLLVKEERPLQFFSATALVLAVVGVGLGIPVIMEFVRTQFVSRQPTAILATGFELLAFTSFVCGLVLDSVAQGRKESKRLAYLAVPGVAAAGWRAERPR
jgi:glycosyltransferase involved in cell wall biosynthesis